MQHSMSHHSNESDYTADRGMPGAFEAETISRRRAFLPSRSGSDRCDPWPGLDLFLQERLRAGSTRLFAEVQELVERHLLTRLLRHTRGNQLRAAQILGITRGKLRSRLRSLGIPAGRGLWSESDQKALPGDSLGAS